MPAPERHQILTAGTTPTTTPRWRPCPSCSPTRSGGGRTRSPWSTRTPSSPTPSSTRGRTGSRTPWSRAAPGRNGSSRSRCRARPTDRRRARRAQGGRRLPAARPRLPGRPDRLHARRRRARSAWSPPSELAGRLRRLTSLLLDAPGRRRAAAPTTAPAAAPIGPAQRGLRHLHLRLHRPAQGRRRCRTPASPSWSPTQQERFGIGPHSRVLQFASPSFDVAFWDLCLGLLSGGRWSSCPPSGGCPARRWPTYAHAHGVTFMILPPALLAAMPRRLRRCRARDAAGRHRARVARAGRRWARGRPMFNAYGPTEATVNSTLGLCDPDDPPGAIVPDRRPGPGHPRATSSTPRCARCRPACGRALPRRRRPGPRLPRPPRPDRRALRRRPLRRAGRAAVPHRRPGALARRTAGSSSSAAPTTRSRSAASASSPARSSPCCARTRGRPGRRRRPRGPAGRAAARRVRRAARSTAPTATRRPSRSASGRTCTSSSTPRPAPTRSRRTSPAGTAATTAADPARGDARVARGDGRRASARCARGGSWRSASAAACCCPARAGLRGTGAPTCPRRPIAHAARAGRRDARLAGRVELLARPATTSPGCRGALRHDRHQLRRQYFPSADYLIDVLAGRRGAARAGRRALRRRRPQPAAAARAAAPPSSRAQRRRRRPAAAVAWTVRSRGRASSWSTPTSSPPAPDCTARRRRHARQARHAPQRADPLPLRRRAAREGADRPRPTSRTGRRVAISRG